jgi:NAD(P)-dependent dehydrogenase (short-subunit alcohol dehydrogenase family)
MEWRNQVAVVTGGSRGIGRATARLLSQNAAYRTPKLPRKHRPAGPCGRPELF